MNGYMGEEPEKASQLRAGWVLAAVVEMALPFFAWAEADGIAFAPALYWLKAPGTAWAARLAGTALLAAALEEAALLFFLHELLFGQKRPGGWAFLLPGFMAAGTLTAALIFGGDIRPLWPAWAAFLGSVMAFALSAGENGRKQDRARLFDQAGGGIGHGQQPGAFLQEDCGNSPESAEESREIEG